MRVSDAPQAYSMCLDLLSKEVFMDQTAKIQPDVVYDVLEKMPRFWQETEGLAEHILTTYVSAV